jgi:hypothetical protein
LRQGPPAPYELPAVPVGFLGRDRELRRLAEVLTDAADRPVVIALHGPGGVGKSALAVAASRQSVDRFPDGQIYVDLCGSTPGVASLTALEAAGQALRSLGVPAADIPRTVPEAAARLRLVRRVRPRAGPAVPR